MNARVLVAGVGNVFLGDDGFGTEVARQLAGVPLPPDARVEDYGIRAVHLAFALLDDYDALILVDAMARGEAPGTVFVVEPDLTALDGAAPLDAHTLHPEAVLRMAIGLGAKLGRVHVVGCEPAEIVERMGLSAPVERAVATAIDVIRDLLTKSAEKEGKG